MFLYIENVYQGSTPLHLACASGHIECVKLLAEANANLTATDGKDKGCMQLAEENCDPLAQWLKANRQGVPFDDTVYVRNKPNRWTRGTTRLGSSRYVGYEPHGDGD